MIKVKPCPICKIGIPRLVHYAIPMKYDADGWQEVANYVFEPMVTYKKVECSNCGATVVGFQISCDDAIKDWNYEDVDGKRRIIVQYTGEEKLEVGNDD